MALNQPLPDPRPIPTYLKEGVRIAAIVAVWGVLAAIAALVVGNIGRPGSTFSVVGVWIAYILGLAGFLNGLLYVLWRTVDYWHTG